MRSLRLRMRDMCVSAAPQKRRAWRKCKAHESTSKTRSEKNIALKSSVRTRPDGRRGRRAQILTGVYLPLELAATDSVRDFTRSLHALDATLYDMDLLAAICLVMQSLIICRLLGAAGETGSGHGRLLREENCRSHRREQPFIFH